ncbi:MAG: four helix bundle protein [Opitutales bacterium]|nr:four helix bundle protein [Opitutales bacterium]
MNVDIKDRTKAFAVRIFKLAEALPKTFTGKTIAGQIARSGSSIAANVRAAHCGRSKAEFVSKMHIAYEEADETLFWLEMCEETNLLTPKKLESIKTETNEIISIIVSIIKRTNRKK